MKVVKIREGVEIVERDGEIRISVNPDSLITDPLVQGKETHTRVFSVKYNEIRESQVFPKDWLPVYIHILVEGKKYYGYAGYYRRRKTVMFRVGEDLKIKKFRGIDKFIESIKSELKVPRKRIYSKRIQFPRKEIEVYPFYIDRPIELEVIGTMVVSDYREGKIDDDVKKIVMKYISRLDNVQKQLEEVRGEYDKWYSKYDNLRYDKFYHLRHQEESIRMFGVIQPCPSWRSSEDMLFFLPQKIKEIIEENKEDFKEIYEAAERFYRRYTKDDIRRNFYDVLKENRKLSSNKREQVFAILKETSNDFRMRYLRLSIKLKKHGFRDLSDFLRHVERIVSRAKEEIEIELRVMAKKLSELNAQKYALKCEEDEILREIGREIIELQSSSV